VLKTGRKWSAKKSALQIGDIVGQAQHGRGGFGLSLAFPKWTCSSKEEDGSQQGAKAGGEEEVYKGNFLGQVGRVDEMGECRTMQKWAGKTFGEWKRVGSVSSQHMFCHHHRT